MLVSNDGVKRLVGREGAVLTMYRDSVGLPTIGVGHLLTKDELMSGKVEVAGVPVPWHQGLTPDQVDQLLDQDLNGTESAVSRLVVVPLTQYQFDALVSLVFNIGARAFANSTMLRLLNEDNYAIMPDRFRRWKYAAGQISPGLAARREDEINQWNGV